MIYIKENGVTVEDSEGALTVEGLKVSPDGIAWVGDAKAEVLLRGLLRWRLAHATGLDDYELDRLNEAQSILAAVRGR